MREHAREASAVAAQLTGKRQQNSHSPRVQVAVHVVVQAVGDVHRHGTLGGERTSQLFDTLGGYARLLRGLFDGVLRKLLFEQGVCCGHLHAVRRGERAFQCRVGGFLNELRRIGVQVPYVVLIGNGSNRGGQYRGALSGILLFHGGNRGDVGSGAFCRPVARTQVGLGIFANQKRAGGLLFDKVEILQFVLDKVIRHGQGHIAIVAGIYLNPLVGTMRRGRLDGIDADNLRAIFLRPLNPAPVLRSGEHRVGAPYHYHGRIQHRIGLVAISPVSRAQHTVDSIACCVVVTYGGFRSAHNARQSCKLVINAIHVTILA